jgi:hypothetical protein
MIEEITFSPSPALYVAIGFIVGLIAGWAIGFFDSNNRSEKKISAAEKNAEIKIREAEEKIRRAGERAVHTAPSSGQDDPGLLRLKSQGGNYTLEMDGTPVSGVLPANRKKRLIDLLTIIRPYLEGGQSQPPAQTPPVTASPPLQSLPPKPVSRPVPAQPVEPVKPTLGAALFPEKKPVEEKPFSSLSIVGQIDSVLQSRLVNTPLFNRGIRLHESPKGAVEVFVGLQKFSSVDEVPDEAIKTAIRAAIAEWEEKYTPGV